MMPGKLKNLVYSGHRDLINKADLILFMIDGSREVTDGDRKLYAQVKHKPVLTGAQ